MKKVILLVPAVLLMAVGCNRNPDQNSQIPAAPIALTQNSSQADIFTCPEEFPTDQQKIDVLTNFIQVYAKKHPHATVQDLYSYRHDSLVSNSCYQTLARLMQNITPNDLKLYFTGKDFGPQNIQFDKNSGVWTSYYAINGQGLVNPDEELILNFYVPNIWSIKPFDSKSVAQNISASFTGYANTTLINKFTASDNITKLDDYFIIAETLHPEQNYGDLYIMKISSISNTVFSVTYSKKFNDDPSNLQSDIDNWLKQDLSSGEGVSRSISDVGVDDSWLGYFAGK